jgi:hypothetical protein
MTITQIEKGRLHHIQTIWAARNNNRNTEPTAKSTSQEEYDTSIRSLVSPEEFGNDAQEKI